MSYALTDNVKSTIKIDFQSQIKGSVTDSNGQPLPGVYLNVKGTKRGTVTDFDGNYSITANVGDTIQFMYLGMKTRYVVVSDSKIINIKMVEDASELDEIVIIGYTEVKQKDLTGAITTLKSRDLVANPAGDALSAIQGSVAGAQIVANSGAPGVGFDIQIRGLSSLSGGTSPLYVIDGVQIEADGSNLVAGDAGQFQNLGPLSFINPDDIETFTVLKDANATAIYGSRGANGVVIITTKKGKSGQKSLNVTLTNNVLIQPSPINVLNAEQYVDFRFYKNPEDPNFSEIDFGPDGERGTADDIFLGPRILVPGEFRARNFQNETFRQATTQQIGISFTSGNETSTTTASLGYLKNNGLLRNTDYERVTSLLNYNVDISDKLTLRSNLNTSFGMGRGATYNSDGNSLNTAGPMRQIIGRIPVQFINVIDAEDVEEQDQLDDPVDFLNLVTNENSLANVIGSLRLDYKINQHLSLRSQVAGRIAYSDAHRFYPNTPRVRRGFIVNGQAEIRNQLSTRYDFQNTIRYRNNFFGRDLRMDLFGGVEARVDQRTSKRVLNYSFEEGIGSAYNIQAGSLPIIQNSNRIKTQGLSYFGRAQFNLFDKYLISSTFRADGSSKFAVDNKWGYFHSIAGAWTVSAEEFLKNSKVITNLKIRGSYGTTGNDRIPNNQTALNLESSLIPTNDGTNLSVFRINNIGDPNLSWEETAQFNLGVDLSLLNRINFTADAYQKKTTELLYNADLPATYGSDRYITNIGQIDNKGLEFSLSGDVIKGKKFSWNALVTASRNISVIQDIGAVDFRILSGDPTFRELGFLKAGDQLGNFYGYEHIGTYGYDDFTNFDGMTQEEAIAEYYAVRNGVSPADDSPNVYTLKDGVPYLAQNSNPEPGDPKYANLVVDADDNPNNDFEVNENDRKIIGNALPDWYGGINNTFTYGKFTLQVNMIYSIGNDIFNSSKVLTQAQKSLNNNVSEDYFNSFWKPDRTDTNVSRTVNRFDGNMLIPSNYYVEDGSFLRLKRVNLSYRFGDVLDRYGIKNLTVFASGFDILTITGYNGFDPEVRSSNGSQVQGVDRASYPRASSVTLGVNIQF
ncbi:MAG: SusC/RagA family TonB-linked outer membrane protein [Polaribacter sp.]